MQHRNFTHLRKSPNVRRRLNQIERLENRRLMTVVPPLVENDLYHAPADQTLEVSGPGVLANDSGTGPLSAHLFSGPKYGTLTMDASGAFVYTPEAGYTGLDSFMYWASEGGANSLLAAVTLRVSTDGGGPLTMPDAYQVNEDDMLSVPAPAGVLDNDTAMAGFPLSAELVTGPQNGTLTLAEDGSFTYMPNANFTGEDSFTYIAHEGSTSSEPTTVTLTVRQRNDKPTAANDSYSIEEDGALVVDTNGVLTNDVDVDQDPLVAKLVSGPLNGEVTLNEDGTFSYTPNANFHGIDGFSYLVNDGTVDSEVATVTISVGAVNDMPEAANDEFTLDEDATLTIDASGILANDSDIDGDTLTAVLVSGPQNGALTLNDDGSFTYTPSANFSGVDGFSYLVSDGTAQSAVATVTLNVSDTNDAPIANNDEYSIDEDTTLTVDVGGVLANDTDGDGDTLAASLVSGPQNGTLTLNSDGTFSYTPNANFHGVDGFSYLVNDGASDSAVATVTINVTPVNDVPTATDDAYSVEEDGALTVDASGVLANDTDGDGDTLTPTVVDGPQNGQLTMNADGSFSYVPNANFNGADSFTYRVSDGTSESSLATVAITVMPVNDAPMASGDSYTVNEDAVLNISGPGVLANDSDPDGDPLSAVLVTGPLHGTLTLGADGSFVYTPSANYNGNDSFTYKASDGSQESQEVTVSIVVNPIPDAPVTGADLYSSGEDSTLSGNVLENDFDLEGRTLAAELVTGPTHGMLTLNSDGSFSYTSAANYFGSDSFTYIANNGVEPSAPVTTTIHIDPINDAPTATANEYTAAPGVELVIDAANGVLANDSDVEGDFVSAVLLLEPRHGTLVMTEDGAFSYMPDEGFTGDDRFYYQASDAKANSNVVEIVIHVVGSTSGGNENAAPVGTADSYAMTSGETLTVDGAGVLANDTDADGDPLTAALVTGAAHGTVTLNPDGSFSYTPEAGFMGEDTFAYVASDAVASSDPVMVTITVGEPGSENLAPVSADDQFATSVGQPLEIPAAGVLGNDTDANGDALTATVVDGPTHGALTMGADGSFVYTPEAGFSGTDSFTYTATDGALVGNVATVTITVATTVNTRPNAVNEQYTSTSGATLEVDAASGVLANDSDAQGDLLTAVLFSGPQHGAVSLAEDGSFSYTPESGYVGIDSFIYRVFDGERYSALAAVTIRVSAEAIDIVSSAAAEGDTWLADTVDTLFGNDDWLA